MEVGQCLLEPKCKFKELNNLSAGDYLDKAEKLFQEIDLRMGIGATGTSKAGDMNWKNHKRSLDHVAAF